MYHIVYGAPTQSPPNKHTGWYHTSDESHKWPMPFFPAVHTSTKIPPPPPPPQKKKKEKPIHVLPSFWNVEDSKIMFKELMIHNRWVSAKKDITLLLTHWSHVFLALTHWYVHILQNNSAPVGFSDYLALNWRYTITNIVGSRLCEILQ